MRNFVHALLFVVGMTLISPAVAAEKHILMLLYRGCEEACQGFQAYFRKQHLPVRFTIRDAAQDKSRIPVFIAEARRLKPDLILTWGTTITQEVAGTWQATEPTRHIVDTPIVFMAVSNPVEAGLVRDLARPGRAECPDHPRPAASAGASARLSPQRTDAAARRSGPSASGGHCAKGRKTESGRC